MVSGAETKRVYDQDVGWAETDLERDEREDLNRNGRAILARLEKGVDSVVVVLCGNFGVEKGSESRRLVLTSS